MPIKPSFVQTLARGLVSALYHDVDVRRAEAPLNNEPEITVANHFGGFADAIVLIAVLPRMPRIIARDVIWKIPVLGWLMRAIRAIPVHKREDGEGSNDAMFTTCHSALRGGGHLLLFPEGITREEPSIGKVKSGASRIALGAIDSGATHLRITPVGIHYEAKDTLRSRISVQVGPSQLVEPGTEVRELTEHIEAGLRGAAPDFKDWAESKALTSAAEVSLRSTQPEDMPAVSTAARDRLASLLSDAADADRAEVLTAVGRYDAELDAIGLSDAGLHERQTGRRFAGRVLRDIVLGIVLLPFAVVGALINFIPALLVYLLGKLPIGSAVQATAKPMAAALLFAITWCAFAWRVGTEWGVRGVAAVLLLMPIYLGAAIILIDRIGLLARASRSWRRGGARGGLRAITLAERQRVVDAVSRAL